MVFDYFAFDSCHYPEGLFTRNEILERCYFVLEYMDILNFCPFIGLNG